MYYFFYDLWYDSLDLMDKAIRKFSPIILALATISLLVVLAGAAAYFRNWSFFLAISAVQAIAFHIGWLCLLGTVIRHKGPLGTDVFGTRILALISSTMTGIFAPTLAYIAATAFDIKIDILALSGFGLFMTIWAVAFVVWTARRNNQWFRLIP